MSAERIARALGIEVRRHREWLGVRGAATVGVHTSLARGGGEALHLFVEHKPSLRLGLLAIERRQTQPSWRGARDLVDLRLGSAELDARIRARAVEGSIAPEILRDARAEILACADAGDLGIDDQRAWLAFESEPRAEDAPAMLGQVVALSRALTIARARRRGDAEGAIERPWAEVASEAGLAFDPDRSTILGEERVVKIEVRVDGEPGLLYTEAYLEWPSLQRGLAIDRTARRGKPGTSPRDLAPPAIAAAFAGEMRVGASAREGLPPEVMRGALRIGETGASLSIDDTGLVARLDHVVDEAEPLRSIVRGALAIGAALTSVGRAGVYR